MKKDEFAKELMTAELRKEKGKFVTQRIIDRLVLLYSPLFDREFLAGIAEVLNTEGKTVREAKPAESAAEAQRKIEDAELADGPGGLAAAVNL